MMVEKSIFSLRVEGCYRFDEFTQTVKADLCEVVMLQNCNIDDGRRKSR